jgi:hypothetical protein
MPTTWIREFKIDNLNDYVGMEDYEPYIDYIKLKISGGSKNKLIKNIINCCWNELNQQVIYDKVYHNNDRFKLEITIFSRGQNEEESLSVRRKSLNLFTENPGFLHNLIYNLL